jgi:hypothetical protein
LCATGTDPCSNPVIALQVQIGACRGRLYQWVSVRAARTRSLGCRATGLATPPP